MQRRAQFFSIVEVVIVIMISVSIAALVIWTGGKMDAAAISEFIAPLLTFYAPLLGGMITLFKALGANHKFWVIPALLLTTLIQNFIVWVFLKWAIRTMTERRREI